MGGSIQTVSPSCIDMHRCHLGTEPDTTCPAPRAHDVIEATIDATRVADALLQIALDLEQKSVKQAERASLRLEAAILAPDDPKEWIRAGREAAQL